MVVNVMIIIIVTIKINIMIINIIDYSRTSLIY